MIATRVPFQATMWLTPIVLCYIIMFAAGIGLILATIMVFSGILLNYTVLSLFYGCT